MMRGRCGRLGVLFVGALAAAQSGCGSGRSWEEREAVLNVYPNNYRADLLAAVHSYVSDPTNIRDAYVSDPEIRPIGRQNRYAACVRFNARNGDGRYTGSRDVLAVFVAGRFDQFVDPFAGPANSSNQVNSIKEVCGQAEYKRFPELEAMKR
jgi:hypothetical protein